MALPHSTYCSQAFHLRRDAGAEGGFPLTWRQQGGVSLLRVNLALGRLSCTSQFTLMEHVFCMRTIVMRHRKSDGPCPPTHLFRVLQPLFARPISLSPPLLPHLPPLCRRGISHRGRGRRCAHPELHLCHVHIPSCSHRTEKCQSPPGQGGKLPMHAGG